MLPCKCAFPVMVIQANGLREEIRCHVCKREFPSGSRGGKFRHINPGSCREPTYADTCWPKCFVCRHKLICTVPPLIPLVEPYSTFKEITKDLEINPLPMDINAKGGKQALLDTRLDLLPHLATLAVGRILKPGAEKYGVDNWRKIEVWSHLNHALNHIHLHLSGDRSETHLANAACRVLFALDLSLSDQTPSV